MTIVRELTTVLNFAFDRSNLDKFEKAIASFSAKISLVSAAFAYIGNKILDRFDGIAKATLDTDELARSANTATVDLIAMSKAAAQFRLDPKNFENSFKVLSGLLTDARFGFGQLFDIQEASLGKLNLTKFIDTHDIQGAIRAIIDYVRTLDDAVLQTRVLAKIFGEEAAPGWLNIVNAGSDAFFRGADANKAYAKSVVDNTSALRQYERDLKNFYTNLEILTQNFVGIVLPTLDKAVQGWVYILSGEVFKDLGFRKNADVPETQEDLKRELESGNGWFNNLITNIRGVRGNNPWDVSADPLYKILKDTEQKNTTSNSSNNTITNNFEISVPAGSPDGEANRIVDLIKISIDSAFNEKSREIISNNPAVE